MRCAWVLGSVPSVFERPHHQRIAHVLGALNAPLLRQSNCLFGGGTAIALKYGEYRESVDIDFLVSDVSSYRALRQLLTGPLGIGALVREGATALTQTRDFRADQYGIRTMLLVAEQKIKFEIILEARIALATPTAKDEICGVATLTPLDLATSKLLANSDRWADDGVFNRDVIDLGMMKPPLTLLRQAVAKAQGAYGQAILQDLDKALQRLQTRHDWLERCMQATAIHLPKAVIWQRLRALRRILV
jgi:hypothetical protein